jgi:hypothetical protein
VYSLTSKCTGPKTGKAKSGTPDLAAGLKRRQFVQILPTQAWPPTAPLTTRDSGSQRPARIRDGAEITWIVCTLPSEKYLDSLVAQIPTDFQFGFKVPDEITVRKVPTFRALPLVPTSQTKTF